MPPTIYLHWAATPYTWLRQGVYHTIVAGDGRVHRLHAYSVDLHTHTYRRNSNSVGLCCACMGGVPDPWTIPPTEAQIEALCREVAELARSWDWGPNDITIERVMTHAEAASNRDGRELHDNYGPLIWGGSGERWDFLQLSREGPPDGGDRLRARIRAWMEGGPSLEPEPLAFRGTTTIEARGQELAVQFDANGSSWARVVDLLDRFDIPYDWDEPRRRLRPDAGDPARRAAPEPRLVPGARIRRGVRHHHQLRAVPAGGAARLVSGRGQGFGANGGSGDLAFRQPLRVASVT